jgi:hypothetical protein
MDDPEPTAGGPPIMSDRIFSVKAICIALFVVSQLLGSGLRAEMSELLLTLHGTEEQEEFGCELANVGDVNGDGCADLLVGASRDLLDGFGRGHLFFGGSGFDTIPDVIFVGEEYIDGFAEALAGAGDLNGDGFDDIIIGARANDEVGWNTGKAYIYFGGAVVDSIPDVELYPSFGGSFGCRVAGCGDVNVDGYDDVVIGATKNNGGQAFVYFGGSPMDTLFDLSLEGGPRELFGCAVCGGADVNADGYPDIVVGDPWYSAGRAYVYFGGPLLDPVEDLVLEGEGWNDHFGGNVAMSDLNGDGAAEVIVSADLCGPDRGRVYVYRGGETIDEIPDLIMTGQEGDQTLGNNMVTGADLDGDGYQDLCLWSMWPERYLVHEGGPFMDRVEEVVVVTPGANGDVFGSGRAMFAGSDSLTGDGTPDLVVGACKAFFQGLGHAGKVYFFSLFDAPVEIATIPHARQIPQGGQLRYRVEADNTTDEPQTFLVWSEVTLPNGLLYEGNPIWGPLTRTVGSSAVAELAQPIPPGAPPGQYSWTVRVGPVWSVYPDSVWDTSSFEFKIVSADR